MSPDPSSDVPPPPREPACPAEQSVVLVISLTAVPSIRLTHDIGAVLKHRFGAPYSFLGEINAGPGLSLRLGDPGPTETEALARRLLKLNGVKKIVAERVCPRRGKIYAISLRSSSA